MKEWVGEGRTNEEAVARGLQVLKISRDEVTVHVLEERASGLLSMFGHRRVKVRLVEKTSRRPSSHGMDFKRKNGRDDRDDDRFDRDDDDRPQKRNDARRPDRRDGRREEPKNRPEPRRAPKGGREQEPRKAPRPEARPERTRPTPPPEKPAAPKTAFHPPIPPESLLSQWKDLLGWDDLTWDIQPAQGRRLPVLLKTSWGEKLAGAGGKPLDAFEYLFNLISSGGDKDRPWVSFRIEGFASAEEQRLVDRALYAAFQVRRTGQPFVLDPMPAALRRKVHQALAHHPDVETASEGEGDGRRIVVKPKTPGAPPTPSA